MCTSSYVECGPVKDVKACKARTKREREVLALREKLPELSDAQMRWVREKVFGKYGYYWKQGEVWCQYCGHHDRITKSELAVSLGVDFHTCPQCGNHLKLKNWKDRHTQKYGGQEEVRLVSFITTISRWTVVRTFNAIRWNSGENPTKLYVREVFQNWIDEDGNEVILSHSYTRSPYHFSWRYMSEWGVKKHNAHCSGYFEMSDVFDVQGNYYYPIARVSPILKRNGWSSALLKYGGKLNLAEVMKQLLKEPFSEELVKTQQFEVLLYWMNTGGPNKDRTRWLHALRICNRNGYKIPDASLWLDYLELLEYFHLDTHNAHYVCPKKLSEEHDKLLRRKTRKEDAEKLAKRIKEAEKYEEQYKKSRGRFFGICFGDENIVITVIGSVKEMAEEGTLMHHCVFAMGYYDEKKYPDSLILSAKDKDGNRLETIELNIKTWKVIQSRGLQNRATDRHADILKLLDKNMYLLRKAA